ncbi:MAG TPA: S58 family peptidase [bacterium]|nr:S58 family peptidase [bacterium]
MCMLASFLQAEERGRARDRGIVTGILDTGPLNAITDVEGVRVGHRTLIRGDSVRTGVTVILPHEGNLFRDKVPAAVYVANGFGKLAGSTQIQELGEIETPIALTNTLSVSTGVRALVEYTLRMKGNEGVRSVNAVVGETNDGWLNDIRGMHVRPSDFLEAIRSAGSGPVEEGSVGAGTGTRCLGFKGGIGTASRRLPEELGGWTVGVLVQTNFGGILTINGAPVGRELNNHYLSAFRSGNGSCMIVVATDAPLLSRQLTRLASRAVLGMVRCGGFCSNGSGDYVIAFSTNKACRIGPASGIRHYRELTNDAMTPLFLAVVEATEEAILNSLFQATDVTGVDGHVSRALPVEETLEICRRYGVLNWDKVLPGLRRGKLSKESRQ